MSARTERVTRRATHGAVIKLDDVVDINAVSVKPGIVVIDGLRLIEMKDGRLIELPPPSTPWYVDGRRGIVVKLRQLVGVLPAVRGRPRPV